MPYLTFTPAQVESLKGTFINEEVRDTFEDTKMVDPEGGVTIFIGAEEFRLVASFREEEELWTDTYIRLMYRLKDIWEKATLVITEPLGGMQ